MTASSPDNEILRILRDPHRLAMVARTGLLDGTDDDVFDRLTRLGRNAIAAPIVGLSLLTDEAQVFVSATGLAPPWPERRETPLSYSICCYTVAAGRPLAVRDVREGLGFRGSPDAPALGIIAYCGAPVRAGDQALGAFFAADSQPRPWSEAERLAVTDLAEVAARELESRLRDRAQQDFQSLPRFARFLNLLPVGVYACDADGRITYFNDRAAALWGAGPAIGQPEAAAYARRRLLLPDGTPLLDDGLPIQAALRSGQPLANRELRIGEAGTVVLVSSELMTDPRGRPLGGFGVLNDVTDMRQAGRLRDELLALVSHELRTPVTVINGMANLLAERGDQLAQGDHGAAIGEIVAAGRRMERVVENMLVLSHFGEDMPEPEPIHLRQAVDAALVHHRRDFRGSNVAVQVSAPAPIVLGVSSWLEVILVNLLSNAEQYGDRREPHLLDAETGGGVVTIRVFNSGRIFTPEEYERLFEPFVRRPETATTVPGAGLGLTVARRLAQAMGGGIEAGARPDGAGTMVTVTLPAAPVEL